LSGIETVSPSRHKTFRLVSSRNCPNLRRFPFSASIKSKSGKNWTENGAKVQDTSPVEKLKCSFKTAVARRINRHTRVFLTTFCTASVFKPIVNQMSRVAKRYLITTETNELLIFRRNRRTGFPGFCSACGSNVEFIGLDSAVTQTRKGSLEIIQRIVRGEIHVRETATGHLLICGRSIDKGDEE
jgi:hypothetical protein